MDINVKTDVRDVTRYLNAVQRKVVPRVTIRALNETVVAHKKVGTQKVAKDLRLPHKNVAGRFRLSGAKKADRVTVVKATKFNLGAQLNVYVRGIPIIQLVSKAQQAKAAIRGRMNKGGIKAKGGRTYKRAFIGEAPGGHVMLFSRLGKGQHPIGVPKIGVNKLLRKAYADAIKATGAKVFRQRFQRLLRHALSRQRVR